MTRKTFRCLVCGLAKPASAVLPLGLVRPGIVALIRKDHPEGGDLQHVCVAHLNDYRKRYVEQLLESERGELSQLETEVMHSLQEHETLTADVNETFEERSSLGDRLADRIATFGGSWSFLIGWGAVLAAWILVNSAWIARDSFDPYPFILLNLVLSCLAAVQAPVIMMSQKRQEARDRLRAENDYRVNLKAELEIRQLHTKLDLLLTHQWQRLMEIQEIQLEVMEHLGHRRS